MQYLNLSSQRPYEGWYRDYYHHPPHFTDKDTEV